jgi:uncharacterized protein (DUF885 family)
MELSNTFNRLRRYIASALAVALTAYTAAAVPASAATDAEASLRQVLDAEREWRLAQFPEQATGDGDHRFDDRLTDRSAPAIALRREHHKQFLAAVRAIDRTALQGEDRLSWDIFSYFAALAVRQDELLLSMSPHSPAPWSADDSPFQVNPMQGPQLELPELVRSSRFRVEDDYRHYLSRLRAIPGSLKQLQALLEAGRAARLTPAHDALARLPDQFASLADANLTGNALFAPFANFPNEIPADQRTQLTQSATQILDNAVVPAVREFQSYLAKVWIPAARRTLAASDLPHGQEYYALSIERFTTSPNTPRELHELGLKEVARVDAQMQAVMQQAGFTGTLAQFRTFLRTDRQFQFASAADELLALRDLAKRVDAQLPNLFAVLPRLPYGIRSMPPEEGNNAPHYLAGAIDGTRAGYFEANTNNLGAWPRWTIAALFLHEAVPGHHLQIARGQEMAELPALRRRNGNSAFNEGWALYAEGLGDELGVYADPYTRFGRLSLDSLRSCRLVVDTGIHSFGWPRERAIQYLIEHAQLERGFAEAEVDRYITWPGQAVSYKVGEQEILALRERAKAALGSHFDIRRFHNAVIDHGSLPLPILREVVGAWIDAERAASAS